MTLCRFDKTEFTHHYPYRAVYSRRSYYQRLLLKRLVSHHQQLQSLPDEIEAKSAVCDVE